MFELVSVRTEVFIAYELELGLFLSNMFQL